MSAVNPNAAGIALPRPYQIPGTAAGQRPAGPMYIGPDDFIQIVTANSLAGVTLRVVARIWRSDGSLGYFDETVTPNTNRTAKTDTKQIGEGYLESICVIDNSNTLRRGQCFVQVFIAHGSLGTNLATSMLVQDYVTKTFSPAFPFGRMVSNVDGRGRMRSITGTTPGAGAECSETVPAGARWRLSAIFLQLTSSAVAGTRQPSIIVDDGTSELHRSAHPGTQAPSLTRAYYWAAGMPVAVVILANNTSVGIPVDLWLFAGCRFRTTTVALDAGDTYQAPQYLVEEFIEL